MKHTKLAVVVMLVALSGLAVAQLIGSSTRIVSQVPFDFTVANKTVPAGQYVVQAATMDGKTLMISNAGAKVGLMSPAFPTEAKRGAAHYALVFDHYGDRYFLSGIKLQGSKTVYTLPESKAEAELRAQNVTSSEEVLLAAQQ
jgi:hypothetical protein